MINSLLFIVFLVMRPARIDHPAERELERDHGYSFRTPWQAETHMSLDARSIGGRVGTAANAHL
jgi:hypothetical protein